MVDEPRGPLWKRGLAMLMSRRRAREPVVPFPQPPITDEDVRHVEELIEKYGWEHLRNKS